MSPSQPSTVFCLSAWPVIKSMFSSPVSHPPTTRGVTTVCHTGSARALCVRTPLCHPLVTPGA